MRRRTNILAGLSVFYMVGIGLLAVDDNTWTLAVAVGATMALVGYVLGLAYADDRRTERLIEAASGYNRPAPRS